MLWIISIYLSSMLFLLLSSSLCITFIFGLSKKSANLIYSVSVGKHNCIFYI